MENNNRQGCRWTKASERLQGDDQDVIVKWRINEEVWCADHCTGKDLKEQMKHSGHEYFWLDESIEPCATSSENYWKQRCEAAEENIKTYSDWNTDRLDVDRMSSTADVQFLKWKAAFDNWQRLKTMPIPSPTGDRDCEELKKENEYLKEVIKGMQDDFNKEIGKYQY